MFFIFGIYNNEKELEYFSPLEIHKCGKYQSLKIFMTYSLLSIFFIPIFKWNKKYFAKYSCCGSVYEINKIKGKKIELGENPTLSENDFIKSYNMEAFCPNCSYKLEDDFDFCPKCGKKL
ncbi:MAG: zinc ribbon domain-containing protein [Peptoniphilaceae bacterium]